MATTATRPVEASTDKTADAASRTTRGRQTSAVNGAAAAVAGAASTARTIAADAATRLPDAMSSSIATFDRANASIQAASDEMLTLGTAVSFGFAAGILIGGGNRLLVGAALVPVAMMGLALLDRASARRAATSGSTPAAGL